jgi:hypothetical protein
LVGLRGAPPSVVTRTSRPSRPLGVMPRGGARTGIEGMRSKTLHFSRAAMSRMLSSTLPKVLQRLTRCGLSTMSRPTESDLPTVSYCCT